MTYVDDIGRAGLEIARTVRPEKREGGGGAARMKRITSPLGHLFAKCELQRSLCPRGVSEDMETKTGA